MTLCGCKTCVCTTGGFQVHITIEDINDEIIQFVEREGGEVIRLMNWAKGEHYGAPHHDGHNRKYILERGNEIYYEYITSKNYKNYDDALKEMREWDKFIYANNGNPTRLKIESHPDNNIPYLYQEWHYKIRNEEAIRFIHQKCMISVNDKGTMFATRRYTNRPFPNWPIQLQFNYRLENVVYDSDPDYDRKMLNFEYNMVRLRA